jgi:hypothetical protein
VPSDRARRLWADLHEVFRNEEAWPIIDEAFEQVRWEQEQKDVLTMCDIGLKHADKVLSLERALREMTKMYEEANRRGPIVEEDRSPWGV